MSAQTMVKEHRQQLMQLRSLADSDLLGLLDALNGLPVVDVRNALIVAIPELVGPYVTASGELAAVMFEDLRVEAGRRGVFYANTATSPLAAERVSSTARWAVSPMVDPSLTSTMFSRLSGSVARMIMDGSRDTMIANGGRERVGYQRMARPNACAFCGMLASLPVGFYKSDRSSKYVVGRGSERTGYDSDGKRLTGGIGGGIKARGKRALGEQYHDDCRCVVTAIYPGTEMASIADIERNKWDEKYKKARELTGGGTVNLKGTLSEWRRVNDNK